MSEAPLPLSVPECMGRYKHRWQWIWSDAKTITDNCLCTTCGAEKDSKTNHIYKPGAPKYEPPATV